MLNSPFTAIGRLEAEVRTLERKTDGKADCYEIDRIKSRIHTLEANVATMERELYRLQEEIKKESTRHEG